MLDRSKAWRLGQVARKLNVGVHTLLTYLDKYGEAMPRTPNTKITGEELSLLESEFATSAQDREDASMLVIGGVSHKNIVIEPVSEESLPKGTKGTKGTKGEEQEILIKDLSSEHDIVSKPTSEAVSEGEKGDLSLADKGVDKVEEAGVKDVVSEDKEKDKEKDEGKAAGKEEGKEGDKESVAIPASSSKEEVSAALPSEKKEEVLRVPKTRLKGPVILDKISLKEESKVERKRPRKRLVPSTPSPKSSPEKGRQVRGVKRDKGLVNEKEIRENIKTTLAKVSQGGLSSRVRWRSRRRNLSDSEKAEAGASSQEEGKKVLHTVEYVSVSDLATLLDIAVEDLISSCMKLGMVVSINQRLDAESILLLADEYGHEVEFSSVEEELKIDEEQGDFIDNESRAPVVAVMGHVDHGKTSLLDYVRKTRIAEGEAGGITQHIGAYEVITKEGRKITFLDTPGHAAFTAMRARGAKVTDVAVIVVAADDNVMPQTEEAINHVKIAGVPFLIAVNKMDKEGAQPDKVREQLSKRNVLVEEWGGKCQSQDISAKTGLGVDDLLEKVLLEADILDLKANKEKRAVGSVLESSLDKGRGYVAHILIENGTLRKHDVILSGQYHGRVKAMFNHLGKAIAQAGPSTPVQILGLDGPPQAGDRFNVLESEKEARDIAHKRRQFIREQALRTQKHITLDEIGRRLAIGSFKELNLILKADVGGSVEALSDALLKLSTEEVQVNMIHKAVGSISESDVLLASASDAIIVGFQVRPSEVAKQLANKEQIEVRLYSLIHEAIDEIKDAIRGLHAPKFEEIVTGTAEVKEVFRITKVGTIAGSMVKSGKIHKKDKARVIRDGIVIHQGEIKQLKHFKEEVDEIKSGLECGLSIEQYDDIQEKDVVECFTRKEIAKT